MHGAWRLKDNPYRSNGDVDVGAKGVITAGERDGVLYVRFRNLHGVLKIIGDKRDIDVLKAMETFDRYDTDAVLMRMGSIDASLENGGDAYE